MTALKRVAPTPIDRPELPSYVRPEVTAIAADLTLVHDLLAGTRRMWAQSSSAGYIRKWKDEDPQVFDIRRRSETVFEGLGRTLSAATGMLFAKPPQIQWNASETAMTDQWANLDAAGTAGQVLVKRFSESTIRDGLGLILVDHPIAPADAKGNAIPINAANEQAFGLRPTWARYERSQIVNWRVATVNNQSTPTLVVLHESAAVDDGEFGMQTVERFRVLRLILTPTGNQATWTLYELQGTDPTKRENYVSVGSGAFKNRVGQIAQTLPIAIAYTGRTDAPFTASIPLMGVAWANLAHWQLSTNLRFYRELASFPQPTIIGDLAPDPQTGKPVALKVGPMAVVHVVPAASGRGGTAEFKWTELTGTSMKQLQEGIAEKLQQMSQLGMSFLVADTRAAETAEAKRLDAVAENSTLATAAQGIEDALNAALEIHAWYLGIDKSGAPVIRINRDFESIALDPQAMLAYVAAVKDAGLPIRLLLEAWQIGGRLPPDANLDQIEADMNAELAAQAKQQALDAAAKADALKQSQKTPAGAGPAAALPAAA